MNNELIAIALTFLFWACYVLFPLVPAVLIYRWFPDTQVTAQGPLSGLKINASGAFAAYLILILVGWGANRFVMERIAAFSHPSWWIDANIECVDSSNRTIALNSEVDRLQKHLRVQVIPETLQVSPTRIKFAIPGSAFQKKADWITVSLIDTGPRGPFSFTVAPLMIDRKNPANGITIDEQNYTVVVDKLTLQKHASGEENSTPASYSTSASSLATQPKATSINFNAVAPVATPTTSP